MQIYVSGSLAYDRIMDFPGKFADHILPEKIHILNVCFMVNGLEEKFGGTAGNIAYNLALLEERPVILATFGKDFDNYGNWLSRLDLPLTGLRNIPDEFTAGAYITTDEADNQITGFNPGAMKFPSLYDFNGIDPNISIAIISPGNLQDMGDYSRTFRQHKVPFIFDPGQSIPAFTGDQISAMMTGAKMLISNDYELEMILKSTGLSKTEILEKTPTIITTLGEEGSIITTSEGETKVSSAKASGLQDPTGAGDAYRAGVIKGLVMKKDIVQAARMGAVCASFSVERHGTQEHHFTMEEFRDRFQKNFGSQTELFV